MRQERGEEGEREKRKGKEKERARGDGSRRRGVYQTKNVIGRRQRVENKERGKPGEK